MIANKLKIIGEYLPTDKNELVRDLFSKFKFKKISNNKFEKFVSERIASNIQSV